MYKVNQDKSTDVHRHSSKLWQPDAEMLSVVSGELSLPGVCTAFIKGDCETHNTHYFWFLPFFLGKMQKSSLNFFLLAKTGTNVTPFIKSVIMWIFKK